MSARTHSFCGAWCIECAARTWAVTGRAAVVCDDDAVVAAGAIAAPEPGPTRTPRPASIKPIPAATSPRRPSPHSTATTLGPGPAYRRGTGQSSPPGQIGLPDPGSTASRQPERRIDLARRGRPVERVEVQTGSPFGQQLLTQAGGVLDADPPYGVRIVPDSLHPLGELGGEPRAGQLCRALDAAHVEHRHDAGQDLDVTATRGDSLTHGGVVLGVEEHVGDGEVRARATLLDEEVDIAVDVRRAGDASPGTPRPRRRSRRPT